MKSNDHDKFFEDIESEKIDEQAGPVKYELQTYPADFTLEVLVHKLNNKEIIAPELQRSYIWTLKQASRLIESFLLGLPVPPIYLYQAKEKLLIIDGLQRLRSIQFFFEKTFNDGKKERLFKLSLNENSELNDKTIDTLSIEDIQKLKNSVLRSFQMKQSVPDDDSSIFHVFERLNTGGTSLMTQEIRNCIYYGELNTMLKKINEQEEWRKILGTQKPESRFRDIELILRFLALSYDFESYHKPMKLFLNSFMDKYRDGKNNDIFKHLFIETTNKILSNLGEKPFHSKSGINKAVFDSVYYVFSKNENVPDDISDRYKKLKKDDDYKKYIRTETTDIEVIRKRINIAQKILFN